MNTEKAQTAQGIGWYLMTGGGDLIARVQSGTLLGEDTTGELSFRAEEALVEFDVGADGQLLLSSVREGYELYASDASDASDAGEARPACVDTGSRAQIHFPHHTLLVDTDFVAPVPSRYTLQIAVAPVGAAAEDLLESELIVDKIADNKQELERVLSTFVLVGGSEAASTDAEHRGPRIEPTIGAFAEEVSASEEDPAVETVLEPASESVPEPVSESIPEPVSESIPEPVAESIQEPEAEATTDGSAPSGTSLRRQLNRPAGIVVAVLVAFLLFVYETQFAGRPPADATNRAGPSAEEEAPTRQSAPPALSGAATDERDAARTSSQAPTGETSSDGPTVAMGSGSAVAVEEPDGAVDPLLAESASPATARTGDVGPGASRAAPRENMELLLGVASLLDAEQLPDRQTIDLAMQSLKALLVAYPGDPDVRRTLERLTERLVQEARARFRQGDLIMAGRLIEQASGSGVAEQAVSDAVAEFSAPRAVAAPRRAPAPATVASAPGERVEVPVGDSESGDVPEASDAVETGVPVGMAVAGARSPASSGDVAPSADVAPSSNGASEEIPVSDLSETSADGAETVAGASDLIAESEVPSGPAPDIGPAAGDSEQVVREPAADVADAGTSTTIASPAPGFPPPALDVTLEVRSELRPESDTGEEADALPALLATLSNQMEPALPPGRTPSEQPIISEPTPPPGLLDPKTGEHEGLYPLSDLRVIEQKPPVYPASVVPGTTASVDLELTVNSSGEVRDVRVVGKAGRNFDREALKAVYQWRFEPVRFEGEQVAVRTAVRLTFRD